MAIEPHIALIGHAIVKDQPRGNFGGGRPDGAGRGGDFAARKPAFSKPGTGGGKPFVPHDARKRPARPAR